MSRPLLLLLCCLLLTACALPPSLPVDTRYQSANHDSRVQYVVVHYTSSDFQRALGHLTQGRVSSHYLIDSDPATIYRLVDENRRAWHAGDSSWQGRTWLNASSIGIELVHPGYRERDGQRHWEPYSQAQIDALVLLLRDILARHQLGPDRVVGHSDVAPQRKLDPGPRFPWRQLAEAGVAIWPDDALRQQALELLQGRLPALGWYQQALAEVGYAVPDDGLWTPATRNVLAAFQMRFRPDDYRGLPDADTAALLAALAPAAREALQQPLQVWLVEPITEQTRMVD